MASGPCPAPGPSLPPPHPIHPRPAPPTPPQVDLAALYEGLLPGQHVYRLRSLVCCYRAHYLAFVLLPELNAWVMLDEGRASRVGGWADVRRKVGPRAGGGPCCCAWLASLLCAPCRLWLPLVPPSCC